MPVRLNSGSKVRRLRLASLTPAAITIITVVTLAAVGGSTRAWLIKTTSAAKQTSAATAATPTPLQVERITIRPWGFEPAAITRPQGQFILVVDNSSGFQQAILLHLDRIAGNRLNDVSLPSKRQRWHNIVDLTPGNYKLADANNPNWVCQITITAR